MPTFSLNEALRYLVTAAIIATYAYFMLTTEQLKALQEAAARPGLTVLITVLIFAASALAFNAYRQLVYNVGIRTLFDLVRNCNYIGKVLGVGPRNFLRRMVGTKTWTEWFRANELWAFCSVKWVVADTASAMRVWGAGVHAFYFLMTASFVAVIFAPVDSSLRENCGAAVLTGLVALVFGLVADTFHEQAETLLAADLWNDPQKQKVIKDIWKLEGDVVKRAATTPATPQ
ncbi:MAG: hypothetical protein KBG84_12205 [Planctomycetes bacterium]|nr:hypothetical protein [Planctomycetota bacterium]